MTSRHTSFLVAILLAWALAPGCKPIDPAPPWDELDDIPFSSSQEALTGGLRFDSTIRVNPGGDFGRRRDFDGDARADFVTYHNPSVNPKQLGIVGVKAGALAASVAQPLTTVFDGSSLNYGVILPMGDLTGDGRADLVQLHDTMGLRVIQRTPTGSLTGAVWYPWETRVDGWVLSYSDNYYGGADVDGDGNQELIASSGWGCVTFQVDASGHLSVYNAVQRGQYLTGGVFYLDGLTHPKATGRFWSGAEELLLLRSGNGFGIAYVPNKASTPGNYIAVEFAPFGQMQDGGWRIGSDNIVLGAGDVDGDGRDDFVLWSPWGLGVLSSGDWFYGTTPFKTVVTFPWGTVVDGAAVTKSSSPGEPTDVVDDFDGDGRADIALVDDSGRLMVLGYDPATRLLKAKATLRRGQTARGGWTYDGSTDFRGTVARFGASDRASILEVSSWGMGILGVDAYGFYVIAAAPYELTCGDGTCNGGETCSTCSYDCGACPPRCGDGICNGSETCLICPGDCGACGPTCGNLVCEAGETCSSCRLDCGIDYLFCQFCGPYGGPYTKTPLTYRDCSYESAYDRGAAELPTGCYLQYGACPSL